MKRNFSRRVGVGTFVLEGFLSGESLEMSKSRHCPQLDSRVRERQCGWGEWPWEWVAVNEPGEYWTGRLGRPWQLTGWRRGQARSQRWLLGFWLKQVVAWTQVGTIWEERQVGLTEQVRLRPSQQNQGKVLKIFVPKLLCAQTLAWPWYTCPASSLTNPRLRACRPLLLPQSPSSSPRLVNVAYSFTPPFNSARLISKTSPIPLPVANRSLAVSRISLCQKCFSSVSPNDCFSQFWIPSTWDKAWIKVNFKKLCFTEFFPDFGFLISRAGPGVGRWILMLPRTIWPGHFSLTLFPHLSNGTDHKVDLPRRAAVGIKWNAVCFKRLVQCLEHC